MEQRYEIENELMRLVAAGDREGAMRIVSSGEGQAGLKPRHRDELRSAKNLTIVLNTLFRKAIEHGGVHPVHIDALSGHFAVGIERCATLESLDILRVRMIEEYCAISRLHAGSGFSRAVARCVEYIKLRYAERVTLDELVAVARVGKASLCRNFKRETGETIIGYLNRHRVEVAKGLLDAGASSVTEVALGVGFEDADYFARVFRRLVGLSPSCYLRGHRPAPAASWPAEATPVPVPIGRAEDPFARAGAYGMASRLT